MSNEHESISKKEMELVLARLEVISPKFFFSSGGEYDNLSRDQMIQHVKDGDEIGKKFIEAELDFLRALKDGSLMKALASNA